MSEDQEKSSLPPESPDSFWGKAWVTLCGGVGKSLSGLFFCYSHLSRFTRYVLAIAGKLVVLSYFLFCVLFLTLRYVVLPEIDHYKADIEQIVSQVVGRPVSVASVGASWRGLRPELELTDVVIHDQYGQAALSLPQVSATFSWRTVLVGELRLDNLTIVKPDLSVVRDAAGKLFVAGIPVSDSSDSGAGADWILSQREIIIRDGKLRWRDDLRQAPELALSNVNLMLRNHWQRHQLALQAIPPADHAGPIDLRADFYHPVFAGKISDVARWKGRLYVDLPRTDLAIWKSYVDYPIALSEGMGSVRAWLDMDHSKVADFTADVRLSNLSVRLSKSLQPLQLARVSGRISASEIIVPGLLEDQSGFAANGHQLSLSNFSLEMPDGFVLPPTSIAERYEPATPLHLEKMKLDASSLDLALLSELAERLPLSPSQHKLLLDLAPRGQLQNFSLQWQGSYPDIQSYRVRGGFVGLGMQAQPARPAQQGTALRPERSGAPAVPGFANLTGQIDATEKSGHLSLATSDGILLLPALFVDPKVVFDQLNLHSHWQVQKDQTLLFKIDDMNFALEGIAGSLSGSHVLPLQFNQPGVIDLKAHLSTFDIRRIARYLPSHTPERVERWISSGLLDGKLTDVDISAKGDLADFPVHASHFGESANSGFKLVGKFQDLMLNYDPARKAPDGQSPEWPLLQKVKGSVALDHSRLEIHADSGETLGVPVADVSATIADVLDSQSPLVITGTASGALEKMLRYLDASPVAHWIGNFTSASKAEGNAKLGLKLELPLHHLLDAKVEGRLQFNNNNVVLLPTLPVINRTNGILTFDEKGFALENINGLFLNEPVTISGGTQRDGNELVKVEGNLSADGLRRSYSDPALQRLLARLTGASRYSATIAVKHRYAEITVESGLQGLALDLPAPLQKAAGETWPVKFEIIDLPTDDPLIERDEVKLTLGSVMAANYLRQKVSGAQADWEVLRGGIGFGQAAPQPDSGLAVNATAQTLNLDNWLNLRSILSPSGGDVPATNDAWLSHYLEPDTIAGRASELVIMNKKLDNVVLGASHHGKVWQVNLASDQASGYASWQEPGVDNVLGRVTARLVSLNIPKNVIAEVSTASAPPVSFKIPALDIIAEEFQVFGKSLGHLELNASNVRVNQGDIGNEISQWHINKLSLTNPDAQLRATGDWTVQAGSNRSGLTYALDIHDAGKLLERLGFPGTLKGGKGKLDGDINWKGLPFVLDIPSLSGQFHLDLENGQFLKVEPGAAKLLGVLNLQALPRRLTLDFRDVFSQGFAFDHITGSVGVLKGTATTDNLTMSGVNASVVMQGSADIVHETQDLRVVVIPDINVGTASVVALAIHPAVGIGTFLAQLFLHEPLMKSLTYEYNVTGSWRDPVVIKQEHKDGRADSKSTTQ